MTNPYEQYVENSVLTVTPLELVTMLYRCALEGIAEARRCLTDGDVRGRVRPVNRAFDAVIELTLSLDHQAGGQLSRDLEDLYGYITNQIVVGHSTACDDRFAEAGRLLSTLLESWQKLTTGELPAEGALRQGTGESAVFAGSY